MPNDLDNPAVAFCLHRRSYGLASAAYWIARSVQELFRLIRRK